MAEVLKSFEFKKGVFGGKKYNWDELLDGRPWRLVEGEDYTCKRSTMMVLARKQAEARGLSVLGNKVEGGVVIKAVPLNGDSAASPAPEKKSKGKGKGGRTV